MSKEEEISLIVNGIAYLDSLLELHMATDTLLSDTCKEIAARRENLIHCLTYVQQDRRKRR